MARSEDNVVFVGAKPFMNYVTGVVMQFTTRGAKDVTIKVDQIDTDCSVRDELQALLRLYQRKEHMSRMLWE